MVAHPRLARLPTFLVFACLCVFGTGAQEVSRQEVPRFDLKLSGEKIVTTEYDTMRLGPLRCDASGDIFLRRYLPGRVLRAPVIEYSGDGERVAVFSLDSAPKLADAEIPDFAVGLRGEVYLLAKTMEGQEPRVSVVEFSDRGEYESTLPLGPSFSPANFATFLTGQFLISGMRAAAPRPDETSSPFAREPFTAVFDQSGRMVKVIELPRDVELKSSKNALPSSGASEPGNNQDLGAQITQGDAATGDDGNVYLMRRTSSPLVYVLSAGGEVVRRFKITPPAQNSEVWAMKYAGGGRLVFEFTVPTPVKGARPDIIFSVADSATGERLMDYKAPPKMGGSFVCYSHEAVISLGTSQDGHLTIQRLASR
jgi:hypothetical protein